MSIVTRNPTSNESPDTGQGGSAVTGNTNTGHGSTVATSTDGGGNETKTCRWSGFAATPGGQIKSVTLKIGHSSQGDLVGAGPTNAFTLDYTLNGGTNWLSAVSRANFTALQSGTFSVALAVNQDLTQVQARDAIQATTVGLGDSASATASISDIRIEVETVDDAGGGMM